MESAFPGVVASEPLFPHRARLGWALAIVALVFLASSRSTVAGPEVRNSDKVVHFAVYGLIGTLVCRAARPGWGGAVAAFAVVSAYGATDEWHQSFVPGRSSELADWVADSLGAATAVALYTGVRWYRDLLERRLWRGKGGIAPDSATTSVGAP